MSSTRLAARQVAFENTAFWRNPAAAFFTFAFPLIFLVLFNLLFGDDPDFARGMSAPQFYVPAIAAFAIVAAAFTNIAIGMSFSRDQGVLKRVRGTPLPAWAYFFGRVGHSILIAILLVILVTAAGTAFYDVDVPWGQAGGVFAAALVGAAALCALGMAVTAIIPNADASPPVVNGIILPILFISDIFIPLENAPGWLDTVSKVFPVRHLAESMQLAFAPTTTGIGIEAYRLGIMAAWGVAGLLLAIRFFSWEPRK